MCPDRYSPRRGHLNNGRTVQLVRHRAVASQRLFDPSAPVCPGAHDTANGDAEITLCRNRTVLHAPTSSTSRSTRGILNRGAGLTARTPPHRPSSRPSNEGFHS